MKKRMYHINPDIGVPTLCRIVKGQCPYGGESGELNHFHTFSEAQEYSQRIFEQKYSMLSTSAGEELLNMIESKRKVKAEKLHKLMGMSNYTRLKIISETKDLDLIMGVIDGEVEGDGWELTGAVLQNPNLPREIIEDMMIDYPDEFEAEARRWLASNRALSHEDLVHIIENDEDDDVRAVALFNEKLIRDYIDEIIASKSQEELINKPYSMVFLNWKNQEQKSVLDKKADLANDEEFISKQMDTRITISKYINIRERKNLALMK